MKPARFHYHRPTTVDEAVDVLAHLSPDATVLAGGQSLLPMMSMRLAHPTHLVDINQVGGLAEVIVVDDGQPGEHRQLVVQVGALARHADLEAHPGAGSANPLLGQALRYVAHPAIRNRGTVVGSLCHADPAAELPAVLRLLDGRLVVRSVRGERRIDAADLFAGPLESTLASDELAVAAQFPCPSAGRRSAVVEVSRRRGDYAVCGVAVTVDVDHHGGVVQARAAYISMGPVPLLLDLTDQVRGAPADAAPWHTVAERVRGLVDPEPDVHASADYRRHLAGVLTERAFREAA
ncbi:MAG: FAD binding domain-containing protein [Angustibacter sp.]